MSTAVPIGVIGAGNISDQYLTNLGKYPDVEVVAIADVDTDVAAAQAKRYGIPVSGSNEVVLEHPDVELVVNLTPPEAHAAVTTAALEAGKHVWSEKVIAVGRDQAADLLETARRVGKRLGVAPDTVLGPGVQTAKRMIERGDIGQPLFASTAMQWQGPEIFHPNPAFLYAKGAGPLLDMGPYYVSNLVHLLGPVSAVTAVGLRGKETRKVLEGPKTGQEFPVEVPSTVQALLRFEGGGSAESLYSTDSPLIRHGLVEVHGTEGTLVLPDPNTFGGDITLIRPMTKMFVPPEPTTQETKVIPAVDEEQGRGIGILDMLAAEREGRPHLASGEFGYHVLDILLSIEEAAESGRWHEIDSRPGPLGTMPEDFNPLRRSLV